MIFEFWITILESKTCILIQKAISGVLRVFSTSVIHDKSFLKIKFIIIIIIIIIIYKLQ